MANINLTQRLSVKKALDAYFCSPCKVQRVLKNLVIEVRNKNGKHTEGGWRIIGEVKGRVFSCDITDTYMVMQVAFWDQPSVIHFNHF